MELIYPLHEERINMFCGMPVCIVTKEGTRHVGVLSHCKSGKITLNAEAAPYKTETVAETASQAPAAAKKKKKSAKKTQETAETSEKAQTQAFPYDPYLPYYRPYNPFGEFFAIDLALIAYLFLLL